MKQFKRIFSLILIMIMLISVFSVTVPVSHAETEGKCGDDLAWRFSPASGVLTILGEGEMYDYSYSSEAPWHSYASSITGLVLGTGVTSVGDIAFSQCSGLKTLSFPISLTRIGNYAFSGCSSLKSVIITDYITDLGYGAFYNCSLLETVIIGNGITEIKYFTFANCTSLYEVKFPETLVSIGKEAFSSCKAYKNILLPDHYIMLESNTFAGTAFFDDPDNWDGEELYLGNYLLYVKDAGQSEVVVNIGTEYIAGHAMSDVYDLYRVYYPRSLKKINGEIFEIKKEGFGTKVDIYYPRGYGYRGNPYYGGSGSTYYTEGKCGANASFSYDETGTVITISGTGPLSTYDYTYDGYDTFLATPWGYIDIYIQEAVIKEGITTMGLYSVPSVGKITLPDSVTHIYDNALSGYFPTIKLPAKLQYIDVDSLPYSLKEITISEENTVYATDNGILYSKDMKTLIRYPGSKDGEYFAVPEHVSVIGEEAFGHQRNLKTLYIPRTVTKIEPLIFETYKDNVTIQCYPDSEAYSYAVKNGLKYELICNHSFTSYIITPAPCTEDGYRTAVCDNGCGKVDKIIDEGSALGHNFVNYKYNEDAACTENGTSTALCENGCGVTDTRENENTAYGHSFTDYTVIIPADCINNEIQEAFCDNGCGTRDTRIINNSALGHTFAEYIEDNNADCTHNGTKTAVCTVCNAIDTVVIEGSALGHSFTDYKTVTEASCTENGVKEAVCDNGCKEKDTVIIEAKGHIPGEWEASPENENENILKCINCGEVLEVKDETPGPRPMPDIDENAWYYEGVIHCVKKGYILGNDKGEFNPAGKLTREQFVVILARVAGADLGEYKESPFTDVSADIWYGASVIWANENGYVNGIGNGLFGVGNAMTRESVAVILCRYSRDETVYPDLLESYSDSAELSDWAKTGMNWALNNRLMGSTSSETLIISPKMTLSRAQAAKVFMSYDAYITEQQ